MSNAQFEDIAILKTLAELRQQGALHEDDKERLLDLLKSDWGRQAADELFSEHPNMNADARFVLRKFSKAV